MLEGGGDPAECRPPPLRWASSPNTFAERSASATLAVFQRSFRNLYLSNLALMLSAASTPMVGFHDLAKFVHVELGPSLPTSEATGENVAAESSLWASLSKSTALADLRQVILT